MYHTSAPIQALQSSTRNPMRPSFRSFSDAVLAVCLSLVAVATFAQQTGARRGITPEDYYAFEFLTDPNISPDGKLVAYVVTRIDRAQNRRISSIWMVTVDQR